MREANKNPTDILKKDIITSKVILHEVTESIDPTTTMISFMLRIQGHKGETLSQQIVKYFYWSLSDGRGVAFRIATLLDLWTELSKEISHSELTIPTTLN